MLSVRLGVDLTQLANELSLHFPFGWSVAHEIVCNVAETFATCDRATDPAAFRSLVRQSVNYFSPAASPVTSQKYGSVSRQCESAECVICLSGEQEEDLLPLHVNVADGECKHPSACCVHLLCMQKYVEHSYRDGNPIPRCPVCRDPLSQGNVPYILFARQVEETPWPYEKMIATVTTASLLYWHATRGFDFSTVAVATVVGLFSTFLYTVLPLPGPDLRDVDDE